MMTNGGIELEAARHQHRVFSFAYHLLRDREAAEDVTQEVWVRLLSRPPEEVDGRGLAPWLLRVTRNLAYDLLRSLRVRRGTGLAELDAPDALELTDDEAGPDALAEAGQFRRRLTAELGRLDEPYRSVVILREIEGLAYQEIADILEMPLNTVRVVLHRGRRKLRERLGEDYRDATIH